MRPGPARTPRPPQLPPRTPRPSHLLRRPQDAALPVDLLVERVVEEGGRLRHPTEELVGRRQPRPPPRAALRRRAAPRLALVGLGLVVLRVGAGAAVGREIAQRVLSLRRHGGACRRDTARTETGPAPRVPARRREPHRPQRSRRRPAARLRGTTRGSVRPRTRGLFPPTPPQTDTRRGDARRRRRSPFLLFHTCRPTYRENTVCTGLRTGPPGLVLHQPQ